MKLCGCGCGQPTRRATRNNTKRGVVRGEYSRFCVGHFSRTQKFREMHAQIDTARTAHSMESNGNWKGGRHVDAQGYVVVRLGRNTARREHRVVAEQMLGRPLLPTEVVHHRNGKRHDNRPENLEVLDSQSTHMRHHLTSEVARERGRKGGWARRAALSAMRSQSRAGGR